jgi:hypothetical protein
MEEILMAAITNQQHNLPAGGARHRTGVGPCPGADYQARCKAGRSTAEQPGNRCLAVLCLLGT